LKNSKYEMNVLLRAQANKISSLIKNDKEIELMRISGKICSEALKKVLAKAKVGAMCSDLDQIAKLEIEKNNASSSFMTVDDYKWTICTTINDQVVHGIPQEQILKSGDVLGVDIGISIGIGQIGQSARRFLDVGRETLIKAIKQAKIGNTIGDISATIQQGIESASYSIVKSLTGHGVGRKLHEEPMVPGFGKEGKGPKIAENMVLAIEVIYAQGSGEVKLEKDNWTISTLDGSLGGLFEQTVAITKNGPIVLTPYL